MTDHKGQTFSGRSGALVIEGEIENVSVSDGQLMIDVSWDGVLTRVVTRAVGAHIRVSTADITITGG